jgi:hypothetical protein
MEPGQDCIACHGGSDDAGGDDAGDSLHVVAPSRFEDDGPAFTSAGTVFPSLSAAAADGLEGAHVHLTDANGRTITLRSNRAGNFYTKERLSFPLRVSVTVNGRTDAMEDPVLYGGCNRCHVPGGEAEGRLTVH